jgi:hypothetical protein
MIHHSVFRHVCKDAVHVRRFLPWASTYLSQSISTWMFSPWHPAHTASMHINELSLQTPRVAMPEDVGTTLVGSLHAKRAVKSFRILCCVP